MTKNPIHPKKLLLSKWTAVTPVNKEKHFMVIKVIDPELEGGPIEQVVIEAVMSKRQKTIQWRSLSQWLGMEARVGLICWV
jgi:tryptophan-rich hypothetical protein